MAELQLALTREEVAKREIGRTQTTALAARLLAWLFLATIFLVPAVQHAREFRAALEGTRASPWPQSVDIFRTLPAAARAFAESHRPLAGRILAANRVLLHGIHQYEDALEDASFLRKALLPNVQAFQTRFLGVGSEQVICGRGRWLFYRPDVDYVTGPGFLEPASLARRAAAGTERNPKPRPDPVEAIADFAAQLARRNITLVLAPTPVKSMIHPEDCSARCSGRLLQNPSHEEFQRRLERRVREKFAALGGCTTVRGVLLFDLAAILVERKERTGQPQYLATDTHWRPEAMESCAEKLARFLAPLVPNTGPTGLYRRRSAEVSNEGDLARMLNLPKDAGLYPEETVRIQPVFDRQDAPWQPDKSADVLLLGDSFTNVYAFDALGWGFGAGFAEHLSYHLGRPIDRIVRNDDGAHATRALLASELAKGRDRLAGKKVVVWQFAARELADGDWKLIELSLRPPKPTRFLDLPPGQTVTVSGTIAALTPPPRPRSKPYADYIMAVHLTDLRAEGAAVEGREALVYLWGMRKNLWTEAAHFRIDREIRVRLTSWEKLKETRPALATVQRGELGGNLDLEPACWAEVLGE